MKFFLTDAHCDTASEALDKGVGFYRNGLHVDLEKMEGVEYTQIFAAFIDPKYRDSALERALKIIKKVSDEIAESNGRMALCTSYADYVKNRGKMRVFLSLEGGEAFCDAATVEKLYNEGVRFAALTWNHTNRLAAGVLEEEDKGLTDFGKRVIAEMNRLGMLVDVSHLNDRSFWEAAEEVRMPLVATHSNSRAVCGNRRNLTDEQFLQICKMRGFVGINLYPLFLSDSGKAKISDAVRHIEHFLGLGGEDIVGMGADFDGVNCLPEGISGAHEVYRLFDELLRLGYAEETVRKISYTNMERVLKENL